MSLKTASPKTTKPFSLTKQGTQLLKRRLKQASQEVRNDWTNRERRHRRLEAFQMQGRLASVLGL